MFEGAKGIGVRPLITKKLKWLKDLIETLIKMDDRQNEFTGTSVHINLDAVDEMLHNIELGKLPRKKDMIQCNEMLKYLKVLYTFDIDWRGDIINCDEYTTYTLNKDSKMNILYSWNQ